MDSVIRFEIPTNMDFDAMILNNNYTEIISDLQKRLEQTNNSDAKETFLDNYGTLTVTVWVAIVMVFCLATVIFCICSCMFYSKIRRWNRNEILRRQQASSEPNYHSQLKDDILPSYTLVSGLPTYDAAIQQFYNETKTSQTIANRDSVRPTVFQIFRCENEKSVDSQPSVMWKIPTIVTSSISTTTQQISQQQQQQHFPESSTLPIYEDIKHNFGYHDKNDRFSSFMSRLQSQISAESADGSYSHEKLQSQHGK